MRLHRSRRAAAGDGNVLPLINVVFLLLTFFMIAGVIERPDLFDVTPPSSLSASQPDGEYGLLLMSADGRLALNGRAITRDDLPDAVSSWLTEAAEQTLTLKADATAPALEVIEVVESLRAAGVPRVLLLTTRDAT